MKPLPIGRLRPQHLIARLMETGIHDDLNEFHKRRIRILNVINVAIVLFSCTFSVFQIFFFQELSTEYLVADTFTVPASLFSLYLTSKRKYIPAKLVAIIINISVLLYLNLFLGDEGTELAGLIGIIGAIFLFEEKSAMIAVVFFSVVSFFILDGYLSVNITSHESIFWLHKGVTLFLIFVILYSIKNEMQRYHKTVSDQKKILLARNIELGEANDIKTRLFSVLSHDLRGPLNAFELYLKEIKKREMSPEEFKRICPEMLESVEAMNLLLKNLLDWSKDEVIKKPLNFERVNLYDTIEENFRLSELQAASKGILLQMHVPCKALSAYADQMVVSTVLRNLICNAIKFSGIGTSVSVSAAVHEEGIAVTVQDRGAGMSAAQIDGIMNLCGHSTAGTNQEKGSGLGLILTQQLLERHGSSLHIESRVGKGTRIRFELKTADAVSIAV